MKHKRVVLDTNVLVSALMTPSGNPAKVHKMFLAEELTLVYSKEILAEYEDVLFRPHLRIHADDAETVLKSIRQCGYLVAPNPSADSMPDEDDRIFEKKAFIITTGAGSTSAIKPIKNVLKHWGINRVSSVGFRMLTNLWEKMPKPKQYRYERKLRRSARKFYKTKTTADNGD